MTPTDITDTAVAPVPCVPLMLRCLSVGDDIFNRHAELGLYLLASS